jgi:hypothetical protein
MEREAFVIAHPFFTSLMSREAHAVEGLAGQLLRDASS